MVNCTTLKIRYEIPLSYPRQLRIKKHTFFYQYQRTFIQNKLMYLRMRKERTVNKRFNPIVANAKVRRWNRGE